MSYLSRRTFIQCQVILDCYFSICQIRLEYVVGEVQKYKLLLVSYYLKDSLSFVVSFAKYTSIPKLHKSILLSNFTIHHLSLFNRVEAVEIIVAKRETVIS